MYVAAKYTYRFNLQLYSIILSQKFHLVNNIFKENSVFHQLFGKIAVSPEVKGVYPT